ncbi:glycerol-3-phosphate acyltransferase [SAR202 cluster bacterium AD-802-E10_MRT_200m]|nr:glycerol-3-phosphate acyltransferase [SAR202 cluster bacterium AD-802-E10_MRT_200m]
MVDLYIWVGIALLSGSIPWALLLSKFLSRKDVRLIGDGNPGTANAWKSSGWIIGLTSLFLEVSKGGIPIYFALNFRGKTLVDLSDIFLTLLLIAPAVGHAWSPFLKFKGGKALAVSWGAWIVITDGLAFPAALIFLGIMHGIQNNHAITVTVCLIGLLVVSLPSYQEYFLIWFWAANMILVMFKHRNEYSQGLLFRDWVRRLAVKAH